jgi:hypothetical protein
MEAFSKPGNEAPSIRAKSTHAVDSILGNDIQLIIYLSCAPDRLSREVFCV